MHEFHTLIVDLTLITIYATLTTLLFKKLKQPIVLGYILAGICAGPFLNFIPTVTDKENITLWADLGVIFLLFGLGLEFSIKKMINVGKSATITATGNILFMLFIGYNVGQFLGWSTTDCFFLGSMISISSTTIIIKAFDDLNIKKQKFTDLVFGELVIEDLVGILLLFLLPAIALSTKINEQELIFSIAKLIFFLVLCFLIGIYLVPTFLRKIDRFLNDETLLLISLSLCFGMVLLATSLGFSSALGAFIMGSILAETAVVERIEHTLKSLKDFFGSIFFVSVGMSVNPNMIVEYSIPICIITFLVIIGKISFSCFGFIISGQPLKTAIHGGFSLGQVGEFAFIIASLGMSIGVLNARVYPIIVAVSVITTFFTPMMIRFAEPTFNTITKILPSSWKKYIEQNASGNTESKREEKLWNLLLKNYFSRIVLFSIIITALAGLSKYFINPFIHSLLPDMVARIIVTIITFMLIAPFLKALIGWETILPEIISNKIASFACRISSLHNKADEHKNILKKLEEKLQICSSAIDSSETIKNFFISNHKIAAVYLKLWKQRKANRLLLVFLTSLRLLLLCFIIMTVIHQFLIEDPKITLLLVMMSILVLLRSRWLFDQYMKIENQFFYNFHGRKKEDKSETSTNEASQKS